MSRSYDVVIERDSEGYYVASVPALPGCHTQARSLDELSERVEEAIALYLEVEDSEPRDFVGIQVRVPRRSSAASPRRRQPKTGGSLHSTRPPDRPLTQAPHDPRRGPATPPRRDRHRP